MRLQNEDFTHFIFDGLAYEDKSIEANNLVTDSFNLTLDVGDAYYIGLYKPFKNIFFELVNLDAADDLSFKYYNGSTFVDLPNLKDRTKLLSKSDFVQWQFEDESKITDSWKKTTINNKELYWIEITGDMNIKEIQGVNLVYTNDNDIKTEFPRIDDFIDNLTSFISFHVSSRDEIVQKFRNGGEVIKPDTNLNNFLPNSSISNRRKLYDLNKFDLLNLEQVKQAAKFLTLSKIFFYNSRNNEDKAFLMSQDYYSKFSQSLKLFYNSIDTDGDGNEDLEENMQLNDVRINIV